MVRLFYENRRYAEQDYFPYDIYRKDREYQLIRWLEEKQEECVKMLYDNVWDSVGKVCPYKQDQFSVSVREMKTEGYPEYSIMTIDLPKPEAIGLCSKLIICYCDGDRHHRYYTVEKAFGINKFVLCGFDETQKHLIFGEVPMDETLLLKRVEDLYVPFLKKDFADQIIPAYRRIAYEIGELLAGCKLITDIDETGENIIEQTAVFLLAIINIAHRNSMKLVNDILLELSDVIDNAITEDEFTWKTDLYADVYIKNRDPRKFWLPVPFEWSESDTPLRRLVMLFGDLLVNPDCVFAYSACKSPDFPTKDLKEFQKVLIEQVAAKIDEFVRIVGNVGTWK